MMSLEDYSSWEETAYLMRSPANARRLAESIEQIEKGKVVRKKLKDLVGK
jgi:antitoxin YefM